MKNKHRNFRPKHARWAKFLSDRVYMGILSEDLDERMCAYVGCNAQFDSERFWQKVESEFASEFGLSLRRAVNDMLGLYPMWMVSELVYCKLHYPRLYRWQMDQDFQGWDRPEPTAPAEQF